MKKKDQLITFKKKRNFNLITPCCNSSNKDSKFVNYNELPNNYGYCHSCGKATLPPSIYLDNNGNEYIWNDIQKEYESISVSNYIYKNKLQTKQKQKVLIKYIDEKTIWKYYLVEPENNLLKYLRKSYSKATVDLVKEYYAIGTTSDGGTIFWQINYKLKVQKCKISYYSISGKRSNKFKVPYKNEAGYYSCLFGEHLLPKKNKGIEIVILVESEKTAIVGYINLPKYTWLAYGGLTQLTDQKLKPLIGHKVLLIPDISSKAVNTMKEKLPKLLQLGVNAFIWDMTEEKTDKQLKNENIYNYDLEDFFKEINNSSTEE